MPKTYAQQYRMSYTGASAQNPLLDQFRVNLTTDNATFPHKVGNNNGDG